MVKNAVTFVDGSPASLSWLAKAVAFCQPHGAKLHVSVLTERIPLDVRDAFTPQDELDSDFAPLGDDTADIMLPASLLDSGVDIEVSRVWRTFSELADRASEQSRLMDIVLVSPISAWTDPLLRRCVIDAIVTDSGTPAMVVPEDWDPGLIRTVALGWNGSAEAARAARAIAPLAQQDARIDVIVLKNGNGLEGVQSCTDIADHLSSQGFKVSAEVRLPDERDAAATLQQLAASRDAQLLVVGGYSRSPLIERLFGGVTRELIAEPHMPVLMVG